MVTIENRFFKENGEYALGVSDLRPLLGKIIETGFNLMLICTGGKASVEIYGKVEELKYGSILNASWEMQLKIISVSDDFEVFYFMMSEEFGNDVYRHLSPSLCDMSLIYPIWYPRRNQIRPLLRWVKQMLWIYENTTGKRQTYLLRNGMESFLLVCDYESEILFSNNSKITIPRDWELTLKFGQLLTKNVKKEHKVSFYADQLCVTPYYLGTITRQTLNASPKVIIDGYIVRHLKTLLSTSNKSLSQIAEELHFDDISYMCKFFRKHTGQKMLEYRKSTV